MKVLLAILRRIPLWLYVGAALGAMLGIQTLRLHFAANDLVAAKAQESAYRSAQATNLQTIHNQGIQLANWQAKFDAGISAARKAAQLAIASAIESANRATKAQSQLKVIYERAPASVRACGAVGVPRAGLVQLRDLASRPH